jgi:prepilin-type N-terminal cleavage/methylation domain-containing protein
MHFSHAVQHTGSSRPAFTLVELLVVIVIIVSLAALSLVGVRRMIDNAKTTKTVSNLRQLQAANAVYSVDNNGKYVRLFTGQSFSNGWFWNPEFLACLGETLDSKGQVSTPVIRSGFSAPSARIAYNSSRVPGPNGDSLYFWSADADLALRVSDLVRPETTVAFIDSNDWWVNPDQWNSWKTIANDQKSSPPAAVAYRNRGKAAAVTFGGNVLMLERQDMDKSTPSGKWRWWYNGKG